MKVDVQRVREYNRQLRECREKTSQVKAEMEFNRKEIARLCEELTQQLGIEVTPENVAEIYKDREEKIEATLKSGEEIMARIKAEEQRVNNNITGGIPNEMAVNANTMAGMNMAQTSNMFDSPNTPEVESQQQYGVPAGQDVQTTNGVKNIQPIFGSFQ